MPISVSPQATWSSFLSLLPPLAIFFAAIQLSYRERRALSLAIVAFAVVSSFLGLLQVALVDLRLESKTYGVKNTLYVGALRTWQLLIPPGVAHGYKVIGEEPSVLVYITDRTYDPSDEGRIAYNDTGIAYDWELQHK